MKNKRIKTLSGCIFLVLVLTAMALITACAQPEPAPPPAAPSPSPSPPAPAETIELTYSSPHPEVEMRVQKVDMPWLAEIEEATGGRVKVQPYWAQSLATMAESYSAVASGLADMAHIDPFHVTGQFPMTELQVACSLDKTVWRPSRVYAELYDKFPEMQSEYADIKILAFANAHVTWLASADKPIRTLEDCKGLKWNGPGAVFGMRAEALGGVPMMVVPPEIYTSTQNGVIDGGVGNPSWLWSFKLGELYKYITLVPFNGTPLFYGMNMEKWNSLPPDIQKAIEDVSGMHQSDRADTEEELSYQGAVANAGKEFGIEFITLPPEELAKWVEADKPVIEQLTAEIEKEGKPGKQFFEEFRQLEEKYSAPEWEIKP